MILLYASLLMQSLTFNVQFYEDPTMTISQGSISLDFLLLECDTNGLHLTALSLLF